MEGCGKGQSARLIQFITTQGLTRLCVGFSSRGPLEVPSSSRRAEGQLFPMTTVVALLPISSPLSLSHTHLCLANHRLINCPKH